MTDPASEPQSIATIRPPESVLSTGQMLDSAPAFAGVELARDFAERHSGGELVARQVASRQSTFISSLRSIRMPGNAAPPQMRFDLRRKHAELLPAHTEIRRFTWPESPVRPWSSPVTAAADGELNPRNDFALSEPASAVALGA